MSYFSYSRHTRAHTLAGVGRYKSLLSLKKTFFMHACVLPNLTITPNKNRQETIGRYLEDKRGNKKKEKTLSSSNQRTRDREDIFRK